MARHEVDGRSHNARRFRQLCHDFAADLGEGLSAAEMAMVRQAAAITLKAEECQVALMRGELHDSDALVRLTNSACRILSTLNAQRRKRSKRAPTLDEYLDDHSEQDKT